jgi:hypothetical protein
MAKFIAKDFDISIAGSSFSSSIAACTLDISVEEQDITSFGDNSRRRIGGLKDGSVTFDFHQDFAAGSVDETIWNNLGGTVAVVIKPTSGSVSSTNPSYSFNALVTSVQPFASSIGDLATQSLTWAIDGDVTRGTA